ncbi:MAG: phosphoenolpyruvate carboxylase [Thermodesulfovibrionales bacterium]|nr:phosphoenolpyruvate carboxylase [Thermodesulfovibrionales bacterium]
MKIPRVMSTQHPDNVTVPFFAETPDMSGDDEIQEAYYAFSHLGSDEQMWDSEGKEIDDFVVRKLLTRYPYFFRDKRLGRDLFLTLRLPNPSVERDEAKVVVETLESIPRSMDAARLFYGDDIPPIFEVILPMTTSAEEINRIYYFYKNFISGRQHQPILDGDITVAQWIGKFYPESINVIPLFEDREHMLEANNIIASYLRDKELSYMRVFLARSDPAMNYGMISAILCNKIALQRLRRLSEQIGVKIYPILGAGSPPFRGNLTPYTVEDVITEYPEVETFTVQSAFKYDNPVEDVIKAIKRLKSFDRKPFREIDEDECMRLIDKYSAEYRRQIEYLAPLINEVAQYIPRRRMRKLHVGLFGYSRSVGRVRLPRVIAFCGACYSIGLPPEIIGLNALTEEDIQCLKEVYVNFEKDMRRALRYFNPACLDLLPQEVKENIRFDFFDHEPDIEHRSVTSRIISALKEGARTGIQDMVIEAAYIRRFLG